MRMTPNLARAVSILLASPDSDHYGLGLMKVTGLKSGQLYPLLAAMEGDGWIEGRWETIDAAAQGRPPRRYYRMTDAGKQTAQERLTAFYETLGVQPCSDYFAPVAADAVKES